MPGAATQAGGDIRVVGQAMATTLRDDEWVAITVRKPFAWTERRFHQRWMHARAQTHHSLDPAAVVATVTAGAANFDSAENAARQAVLAMPGWNYPVDMLARGDGSTLEVHPIANFRLGVPATTSDRVEALLADAASLAQYNDQQRQLFAHEQERTAERDRQQRAADAVRSERTRRQREQQAEQIRLALSVPSPSGVDQPAVPLLHRYLHGHRDRNLGWDAGAPERWKCVAFFHHIASNESDLFGPPQVASTLRARGVSLNAGVFKVIAL